MDSPVDPAFKVFTHCSICSEHRSECNCEACEGCGQVEFCICNEDKTTECDCKTLSTHKNLVCDCSCTYCIGQRLEFQERIESGSIPSPWCSCDFKQKEDGFTCNCTCEQCAIGNCQYSFNLETQGKCPNCGVSWDILDNYGFCSRRCMVGYDTTHD